MSSIKILYLVLLIPTSVWAADGRVTTSVLAEGGASYIYEEYHPVKFDLKTFTFCAGRTATAEYDQDQGQDQGQDQKPDPSKAARMESSDNSGTLSLFNNIHGDKSLQSKVLNQSLKWKSDFDMDDYSFNVVVKKVKGQNQYFHQRDVCSTRSWHYRIDNASSKVHTSVNLVVPDNVYIVELEKIVTGSTMPNSSFVAEKVYSAVSGGVSPDTSEMMMKRQEKANLSQNVTLFFVRPGEEINLAVDFADSGEDYEVAANIKVTFLGYNRCQETIAKAFQGVGRKVKDGINASMIQQYFDADFAAGPKDQVIEPKAREGLSFLGCLTSQDTIRDILYRRDITQVQAILESVSEFSNKIDKAKNMLGAQSQFLVFLSTVQLMARQALSQSLLNVMKPMCELMPVRSLDGDYQLTTFAYIHWYLEKALALLDLDAEGVSAIARYTQEFTDQFMALKDHQNILRERFKDFTYDDRVKMIPLFEDFELNDKAPVVSKINSYLNHIPISIAQTADLSRLEQAANALFDAVYTYHYHVLTFAEALGQQLDHPINWNLYLDNNDKVQKASSEFVAAFKAYQMQFSGPLGEQFSSSLKGIFDRHYVETDEALKILYQGFFNQFAKFYNLPGQEPPKFDDYYRCFTEPLRAIR